MFGARGNERRRAGHLCLLSHAYRLAQEKGEQSSGEVADDALPQLVDQ